MKNIEYFQQSGLVCDYCDFVDETLEVSQESVGMSCPKCGENLLTQEDFDMTEKFRKQIDFINSLSKEEIQMMNELFGIDVSESDDVQVKATIKIHNGIHLQDIEINSERDNRVREFLKNIDGKELFKESNDRAREFFKNINELPM